MKLSKLSLAFFGSALLLASAAVAGDSNKGSLQLFEKVNIEGKELNPGHYTVTWEGSGSDVQVTVLQGKQAVATFPAHLAEQTTKNNEDAYGSAPGTDGARNLTAIYPSGKRFSIEVGQNAASQPSSTPAAK